MQVNFEYRIDKPMEEVFNAIVDRKRICNYFISNADSDLIEGKTVKWQFEETEGRTALAVRKIERNKLIEFEWSVTDLPTVVKLIFEPIAVSTTVLKIIEGQWGAKDDGAAKAMKQTISWTNFFCALKAYLFFNVNLRTGTNLGAAGGQGEIGERGSSSIASAGNIHLLDEIRKEEGAMLRREIARDFHDEMGNQLARIINYVGWIKMSETNVGYAIAGVEESAKNLMSGTKDFIWALDSSNDSIFNLFIHIKEFGEKLFLEKNIQFRSFYTIPKHCVLPFGSGRQINLLFKEAMTNAFKHSKASKVEFRIYLDDEKVVISFQDNGIGVSQDTLLLADGGFANMRVRSKRIFSELSITTSENNGVEIKLIVNI